MFTLPVHLKHGDTVEGINQTKTGIDTEPDVQGESNVKVVKNMTPYVAMETNSDVQDIVKGSNAEVVKDTTRNIANEPNSEGVDVLEMSTAEREKVHVYIIIQTPGLQVG